jgi:hypothetical protein
MLRTVVLPAATRAQQDEQLTVAQVEFDLRQNFNPVFAGIRERDP